MKGEIFDYPTRMIVSSEDDPNESYLVDLCCYKVGDSYNGKCMCADFMFRHEPHLRRPNNTIIRRCKHIRWARENVLDYLLPVMAMHDPNIPEERQT